MHSRRTQLWHGLSGLGYPLCMAKIVNMHSAKTHFSKLAKAVEGGEEIVIARAGEPFMKMVPLVNPQPSRTLGLGAPSGADFDWEAWNGLDDEVQTLFPAS